MVVKLAHDGSLDASRFEGAEHAISVNTLYVDDVCTVKVDVACKRSSSSVPK